MTRVYVYCGIPGSGKSTAVAKAHSGAKICSADNYFLVNGEYKFDPSKLPNAHGLCLRRFTAYVISGEPEIVVDNTNTTAVEIAPYAALALAYSAELKVITVTCDPEIAAARNIHGVPREAVLAMHRRLMAREMPPWWPHEFLSGVSA